MNLPSLPPTLPPMHIALLVLVGDLPAPSGGSGKFVRC